MAKEILNQQVVYERLKTLLDPELGINLVDLGLIYEVTILPAKAKPDSDQIYIKMTLTSPGCPLAAVFEPMIRGALKDLVLDSDEDIIVDLTFEPPWTPDMMDEEIKLELGI